MTFICGKYSVEIKAEYIKGGEDATKDFLTDIRIGLYEAADSFEREGFGHIGDEYRNMWRDMINAMSVDELLASESSFLSRRCEHD